MSSPVTKFSSPEEKIELFRSLFRGRDDVYPRRFESQKTGKSGYSPVCANEWVRGLCDKRNVKCVECPNRQFLPVTDDVIRRHLSGAVAKGRDFVAGVYPMLRDETCYFLAADFDKETWRDDIDAVRRTVVLRRRSYIGDLRPCLQQPGSSGSTRSCQFSLPNAGTPQVADEWCSACGAW